MAKLHRPHAGLLLVRSHKQVMIPLTKDKTSIGRKQADIILDDTKVSSLHAEIERQSSKFIIRDLKSTNGTFVNRNPVVEAELVDQDVVEIGSSTFCFFEDLREFHGNIEPGAERAKSKAHAGTYQSSSEIVTTTKTLAQMSLEISILAGPDAPKKFKFKKSHVVIGRSQCDLALVDLDVSRNHAMLEVLGRSSVYVRDLGSTNGTLLNGELVEVEKIHSGDEIRVGQTVLCVAFSQDTAGDR